MQAINKAGEIINIGYDLSRRSSMHLQPVGSAHVGPGPYLQELLADPVAGPQQKYGFSSLTYDTGAGFVTPDNYKPVADLAKAGIR
jgi:hypothetical protein